MAEYDPDKNYEHVMRYRATDKGREAKRRADRKYEQTEAARERGARYRDNPEQRARKRAYARERYLRLKAERQEPSPES